MTGFDYAYFDLFNPTLTALRDLGGSGTNSEIEDEVAKVLNLSDEEISDIHRGNRTKFSFRLAWARSYLKTFGALENSSRGVWALTPKGLKLESVDPDEVKRFGRKASQQSETFIDTDAGTIDTDASAEPDTDQWKDELLELLKGIEFDAFERLCKRMLRELGFANVEVTGKSGDGGIDGKGVVTVGSVLSFHVVFQCKRYSSTVSSDKIRDFRGAMIGRADKGLFMTTGTFTRDARREAQREGAPPIDLIDGYEIVEHLKNLRLGIEVELIEKITINHNWFYGI